MHHSLNPKSISTVVFDWGGVLIENPVDGIAGFIRKHYPTLPDSTFGCHAMIEFQKGTISENTYWNEVFGSELVNLDSFSGSLWRTAFQSTYTEKKAVIGYVKTLQQNGIVTAILSNTEKPSVEMFRNFHYQVFDHTFFSCEWGMVKPNKDIYERSVKELGGSAGSILFIDDKPENVDAASSIGMEAHVMTSIDSLRSAVTSFGLPPLDLES